MSLGKISVSLVLLIFLSSSALSATYTDKTLFDEELSYDDVSEELEMTVYLSIEDRGDIEEGEISLQYYDELEEEWVSASEGQPFQNWGNISRQIKKDTEVVFSGDTSEWEEINALNEETSGEMRYRYVFHVDKGITEGDTVLSSIKYFNWEVGLNPDNSQEIKIESQIYSETYGNTVRTSFNINNKGEESSFITVSVPESEECSAYRFQDGLNAESFSSTATYDVPAETEVNPLIQIKVPAKENFDDLRCEIQTSSTVGEVEDFYVDVSPTQGLLAPLYTPLKSTMSGIFPPIEVRECPVEYRLEGDGKCPAEETTNSYTINPASILSWLIIAVVVSGVGLRFYKETWGKR